MIGRGIVVSGVLLAGSLGAGCSQEVPVNPATSASSVESPDLTSPSTSIPREFTPNVPENLGAQFLFSCNGYRGLDPVIAAPLGNTPGERISLLENLPYNGQEAIGAGITIEALGEDKYSYLDTGGNELGAFTLAEVVDSLDSTIFFRSNLTGITFYIQPASPEHFALGASLTVTAVCPTEQITPTTVPTITS